MCVMLFYFLAQEQRAALRVGGDTCEEHMESMVHVIMHVAAVEMYLHSRCTAHLRAKTFLRGVIYYSYSSSLYR